MGGWHTTGERIPQSVQVPNRNVRTSFVVPGRVIGVLDVHHLDGEGALEVVQQVQAGHLAGQHVVVESAHAETGEGCRLTSLTSAAVDSDGRARDS